MVASNLPKVRVCNNRGEFRRSVAPTDNKRVRTKFLHLLVGYRTVLRRPRSLPSFAICMRAAEVSSWSDRTRRPTISRCGPPACIPTGSAGARCGGLGERDRHHAPAVEEAHVSVCSTSTSRARMKRFGADGSSGFQLRRGWSVLPRPVLSVPTLRPAASRHHRWVRSAPRCVQPLS